MLSDEERKAIENLKIEYEKLMKEDNILFPLYKSDAKRLIDIIEKQSKEIEELKKENKEIRVWKYVIDNPIDLKKLSELDIIKIFGKSYIAKDIIKAKIEELENMYNRLPINPKEHLHTKTECKIIIGELQSLLKKE